MPVSHSKKVIFIHIPKNAGTSVTLADGFNFDGVSHLPAYYYKNNFPDFWRQYLKISIVRNPWDRLVSCYEYARMIKSYYHSKDRESLFGPHPDYNIISSLSFEDLLKGLLRNDLNLMHPCWGEQYKWICEKEEVIIDKLFRYENVNEDLEFKKIFGTIKRINCSDRKYYKEYYSNNEQINCVKKIYEKDIEIFNYSF